MINKSCYIVTFYNAINYGAVLQTYALKKTCSNYCSTFIFRHNNEKILKQYNVNPFSARSLKGKCANTLRFFPNFIQYRRFNAFVKSYLLNNRPTSDHVFYITGSDQVWNYNCTDFDKTYFLDFVKEGKLKNSYSASFGIDEIPPEYVGAYQALLSGYNAISVREESARKIMWELAKIDVPVTLDPTLLLSKLEWANEFCHPPIQQKYILVYAFVLSDSMCKFVNDLSFEKDLHVIILMPNKSLRKKSPIKRAKYKTSVSPGQWVNYFYNASYVVTNSFHGTAFSINFNKQFFIELLPPPAKVNTRLINILEMFDLQDRLISDDRDLLNSAIDYSPVNTILKKKRDESLNYLKSIVKSYDE